MSRRIMAKNPFFLRGSVDSNGTTYEQTEIDLGSFVNLGVTKSTLMRIHSITAQITDANLPTAPILKDADYRISWQLTTQSQTAIVDASDKSVISTGAVVGKTGAYFNEDFDRMDHAWQAGYLVGVDSIFLGVDLSVALDSGDVTVALVMENTLESATQASSTALALSQQ